MKMVNSTDDVISIESSDSDSDCQIVEVVPSATKRGKNKLRWQNKLSSNMQRRGREMAMHRLNNAADEDRLNMSSASRGYAKRLSVGLVAAGCGLQGTNSKTDHLPDTESNNTDVATHVDLENPFSVQQYIADSKAASISRPCSMQRVECNQDTRFQDDDEDEHGQRSTRSRSGSTATLDFSSEIQSYSDSEKDTHGIVVMFDEAPESTEETDTRGCKALDACTMRMIPHNSGYLTPTEETSLERPDPFILQIELQGQAKALEEGSSFESINVTLPPHKEASKYGHQLPQAGEWDSVINVAAFEALPGPLFTRPKQILNVVTYESMMEERAAQGTKEGREHAIM
ncbi:hypothetical protein GGI35DRAFT_293614 [Trichoderma velutinum]